MHIGLQFLLLLALQSSPHSSVLFDDALAKKQITASAQANQNTTHYQQPVLVKLKNITAEAITVELPVGRYFQSSDTTDQNFVSTEPLMVSLSPGQTLEMPVSAMCVNHSKASPQSGQAYAIKKPANSKLLSTAKYIHQNKLYSSYLGQTVMWCVSDDEPLESVIGYEDEDVHGAVQFLATLLNKAVPKPPAPDDYLRNPRAKPKKEIGGDFEFRFSSPKAVHIAMFDENNIAVRELYNNPAEPAGEHKVDFVFDGSVYNNGTYYVRFLCDNRILMEHQLDL